MANRLETNRKRILRITESASEEALRAYSRDRIARKFGLRKGEAEIAMPQTRSYDIERDHYRGRKRLRWLKGQKEAQRVASEIEALAASSDQGTKIDFDRYIIHDIKIVNGREKRARKLRRGSFGWKSGTFILGSGSVDDEHKRNFRTARSNIAKITKTDVVIGFPENVGKSFNSMITGTDMFTGADMAIPRAIRRRLRRGPIAEAIARDEKERKALAKLDDKYKVSWRAKWVAMLAEMSPYRAGEALAIGKTKEQITSSLYYMMLNIGDNQLDPEGQIRGPLQPVLDKVERLQDGILGVALSNIFGKHQEKVDRTLAWMTKANKYTSRDIRRSRREIARMFVSNWLYTNFRQGELIMHTKEIASLVAAGGRSLLRGKLLGMKEILSILNSGDRGVDKETKAKRENKAKLRRYVFPTEVLVEEAEDVRANQHKLGQFAWVESFFAATDFKTDIEAHHQRVIAEGFIKAYETLSRFDKGVQKVTDAVGDAMEKVVNVDDGVQRLGETIKTGVNDVITAATTGETEGRLGRVKESVQSSIRGLSDKGSVEGSEEVNNDRPKSTKEQVDEILAQAPELLAGGTLTPIQRIKWQTAFDYAQSFDAAYKRAQAIVISN